MGYDKVKKVESTPFFVVLLNIWYRASAGVQRKKQQPAFGVSMLAEKISTQTFSVRLPPYPTSI